MPYYGEGIYIFDGHFQNEDIFYENKDRMLSYINLRYEKIISFPYTGLDILPNEKISKWNNNPQIFKYNKDKKFTFNIEYSNNIIDYFEKCDEL